jgi:deoxyribodipyrimidine photolyase-related protein
MVFLNLFVLCGVHPECVVRWFTRVCAIDAYRWVMVPNVYAMGGYAGTFMSKQPYVSTDAYVARMSDYGADRTGAWKALFYAFLVRNKARLTGASSVYMRNLAYFERLPEDERREHAKKADAFVRRCTTDDKNIDSYEMR